MVAQTSKNCGMQQANRTITATDREAAARLRSIWNAKKRALGLTQESAAFALGMNQSAVSQYLAGKIAIGVEACIRFAQLLGVEPTEIRPDVAVHAQDGPASIEIETGAEPLRMTVDEMRAHGLLPQFARAYVSKSQNRSGLFSHGDVVLIDTRPCAVVDGECYAIDLGDGLTERILFRRPDDRLLVRSPDDRVPTFEADAAALNIAGRVVFRSGWV